MAIPLLPAEALGFDFFEFSDHVLGADRAALEKGKTMPGATISLEDRQAIYDTLARYVWGMDTGDIEGVVATFTPDGVVKDVTGKRWDAAAGGARGFATYFLTRPNRRGGQHHMQHLFVDPAEGGGYRVTSYWVSLRWDAAGDQKAIRSMGSYVDTCVKVNGQWLIKEKIIDPWNSATAPLADAHV